MMTANEALAMILKNMEPALRELRLKTRQDGNAAFLENDSIFRIALADDRAALELQNGEDTPDSGGYAQLALSLLELPRADERDCKYIAGEFTEALEKQLGAKKPGAALQTKKQPPKSISKTAIRNGEAYYDALSFVNSFTGIYQELRGAYKENYERYGEFLPEEFFLRQGGNEAVLKTIKSNDKVQMKRLFNLFNEVYENGVNEVQSLIAVTIMGALENDERLLASCVDFMSSDLAPVVIRVNAYLAAGSGRKAKQKLENPPLYKPKKEKKPGFFQQLMGGGGMPGM